MKRCRHFWFEGRLFYKHGIKEKRVRICGVAGCLKRQEWDYTKKRWVKV